MSGIEVLISPEIIILPSCALLTIDMVIRVINTENNLVFRLPIFFFRFKNHAYIPNTNIQLKPDTILIMDSCQLLILRICYESTNNVQRISWL